MDPKDSKNYQKDVGSPGLLLISQKKMELLLMVLSHIGSKNGMAEKLVQSIFFLD